MIINHNITALNTHRQLSSANNAQSNSMEKLASGLRINKAGDDAAGLAISEKMRGQIRGLDQAQRNAQDGISLIQTAEGALNESHSILQRMRELSVQSSNDTNTASDREELQKEVNQLSQELSRIGDNTEFNTQNLLDGSFEGTFQIGANEGQNLNLKVSDMRGSELGVTGSAAAQITATTDTTAAATNGSTIDDGNYTVSGNAEDGYTMTVDVTDGGSTPAAQSVTLTSEDGVTFTGTTAEFDDDGAGTMKSDEIKIDFAASGGSVTSGTVDVTTDAAATQTASATASLEITDSGLEAGSYKISADGNDILDSNNQVIASHNGTTGYESDGEELLTTGKLIGGSSLEVGGIDISTQAKADSAITKIQEAIDSVSAERSKLGSVQNRLDHTINNLGTSSENLTAAESRIRDVDMAKEVMNQTKQSILAQASQAMLAKANQQPQGVLQLLR